MTMSWVLESNNHPVLVALFFISGLVMVSAALRIYILYFQTLIHAILTPWVSSRGWWIVEHLFLGPFISVPYYFLHQVDRLQLDPIRFGKRSGNPESDDQ